MCPSATVATMMRPTGTELRITGDVVAETINILDQGDGHVSVTNGFGTLLGSAANVSSIRFDGGRGHDAVFYTLANPLTHNESIVIQMGSGAGGYTSLDLSPGVSHANLAVSIFGGVNNDVALATLGPLAAAHVSVLVSGGDGKDHFIITDPHADIAADSSLQVLLSGGAGDDVVETAYTGLIFGSLNVAAYGGDGADTVDINVKAEEDSTGTVKALASGDAGIDHVTMNLNDYSGDLVKSTLKYLRAVILNPHGEDLTVQTPNVTFVSSAWFGFL